MLIDRVGSPWDWTRRPRYFDNEIEITARLNDPKSRIFVFFKKSIPVGYCLAVPFSSLTTNVQFSEDDDAIVEIENFGFFPEFTGLGYGQYILPQIFSRLFRSYELIYLSSRSTNHKKVIPFYKGLGMIVKLEEIKPNDLVPEDRILEEVMDKKTIHILK
jgi:ribosomal protein S18 acetylase RimI-like enzyme